MTSLGEVYHGDDRAGPSLRQIYAGSVLFLVGVGLVVAGIAVATTNVLRGDGTTLLEVREYGGVLAGVGVPAVFIGISTVLPAKRTTRAAAGIGASIALLGVALFTYAYPCRWSGANCGPGMADLTLPTVGVYFLGALITFWCLFVGIANFKTRNDPGGTVTMEVTRQGETKVIEVDRSKAAKGSVGLAGGVTDRTGSVGAHVSDGGDDDDADILDVSASAGSSTDGGSAAGGTATRNGGAGNAGAGAGGTTRNDGAETWKSSSADAADRYCGNCEHFEYVRTERGIQPYCDFHDGLMEDMDACEDWSGR